MPTPPLDRWLDDHRDSCVQIWTDFLRFPSISADSGHDADCAACADWLLDQCRALGFAGRLIPTASHPLVFAERAGRANTPSLLLYGHYDVQPADPLDLWTSPPFEPTWRGDRLYARGAQDNKGQIAYVLAALRALIDQGVPLPPLRLLFEGDEECGRSAAIDALAALDPGLLRADILYNCDALTVTPGRSTLTLGLRGLTGFTVEVRGAQTDLHSGIHGGMAPNPALVLARLLAALHDDTGRIAVPGFYDGVVDPTPQERALANADAPSAAEYAAQTGVPPVGGESAFTPAERAGFRPTLEINGFHSGYGGPGSKTIIPAVAQAKITLRLAAGQDPAACLHRVRRFLEHRLPAGLKIAFTETAAGAPALKGDVNAPAIRTAAAILTELDGRPPAFHWEGGSIPIMARLPALTGAQPLIVGFGSTTDRIHAPDESFSWSQFRQGFRFAVRFLGPSA